MNRRRAIVATLLAVVIALFVAVGAVIAATVTRTRTSEFDFSFGQLTATPVVSSLSKEASFSKPGDSVTFDISVTNTAEGNPATYSLSVNGSLAENSAVSLAQFLCYVDDEFVGTLASLEGGQSIYQGLCLAEETEGRSHTLKIEYHNTGAPSQLGNVNLTVTCTASSLDTNAHTLISSADELLYTLRAIDGGYITSPRTLILTGNVTLPSAEVYDLKGLGLSIDTFGHTLNLGGITLDNADVQIYSSRTQGAVSNLTVGTSSIVGTGSFVDFKDSVTVSDVTLVDDYDMTTATEAIKSYLVHNFQGRDVSSLGGNYFGSLAVYASGITPVTSTDSKTVKITVDGNTYTAFTTETAETFADTLTSMMSAQRVGETDKGNGWVYSTDHVTYDLYLPTSLYLNGDNAAVVWDSNMPSVIDYLGRYNPDYCARTVVLTAAISAYGNTIYKTYYVRAAGISFEERMAYICSQIGSLTLSDSTPQTLVAGSYIDLLGRKFNYFGLSDFTAATTSTDIEVVGNSLTIGAEGVTGDITVAALGGANKSAQVTLTGSFSEDGATGSADHNVDIKIDVAAVDPSVVLEMVQQQAENVNVLYNILNDENHDLHDGTYVLLDGNQLGAFCGQGSFALPATYPLDTPLNRAQYVIGYKLKDTDYTLNKTQTLNNGAATIVGNFNIGEGTDAKEVLGNVVNIIPENFKAYETSLYLEICLYGRNGTTVGLDETYGDMRYIEIVLPAAFTDGDPTGFTSNATDTNGIDYVFAQARDQVEAVAPIVCESHPLESRKFILIESIDSANTAETPLTSLDLSAPSSGYTLNDGETVYKVSSIYGLMRFTELTSLKLSGAHIGDESAYVIGKEGDTSIYARNMDIIAANANLAVLNLENCDMSNIVSFKSLTKLKDVNLAGNAALRNISALLFSSESIEKLDICDTYAAEHDLQKLNADGNPIEEGETVVAHYHSVLEEMYDDYVAANSTAPTYYVDGHSGHTGELEYIYTPRVFDQANSDDVVEEIAKHYAYRFDNIIEMTNVIHLQNTVIVADGEPAAAIGWEIANVTKGAETIIGDELTDGVINYKTSNSSFANYGLVLDLTPGRFRLTRGYTVTGETNKVEYTDTATGWVVDLKMTVTVAGRSYARHFYISVLDGFDAGAGQ